MLEILYDPAPWICAQYLMLLTAKHYAKQLLIVIDAFGTICGTINGKERHWLFP